MENLPTEPEKAEHRISVRNGQTVAKQKRRRAHPAHAVNPTQSFTDTVALIDVRAELRIVLMSIHSEQR